MNNIYFYNVIFLFINSHEIFYLNLSLSIKLSQMNLNEFYLVIDYLFLYYNIFTSIYYLFIFYYKNFLTMLNSLLFFVFILYCSIYFQIIFIKASNYFQVLVKMYCVNYLFIFDLIFKLLYLNCLIVIDDINIMLINVVKYANFDYIYGSFIKQNFFFSLMSEHRIFLVMTYKFAKQQDYCIDYLQYFCLMYSNFFSQFVITILQLMIFL